MHVLVRYELGDFDTWKETFDDRAAVRAEHGCRRGQLFSRADNDRKVVLLAEWDSAENAEAYFDSTDFRRAMQDASVESKPDVTLVAAVDDVGVVPPSDADPAANSNADGRSTEE